MTKLIARILIVALTLLGIAQLIPGIDVRGFYPAIIAALILGVLNVLVRPILVLLTLPISILTLGLFVFVLNALLFWFVASFVDGFTITGFVPALLGSVIVSIVSSLASKLL